MRSVYGDWVTPSDSVVIVAPSELGQPFRDIKRKLLRDKTFIHPGTSVEIRVRAIRGPRRGLTSPTLRTRFLDGPIEIWRPLPACLMDNVRDTEEVTAGLRRLSVHSGATIGSLRETLKVRRLHLIWTSFYHRLPPLLLITVLHVRPYFLLF